MVRFLRDLFLINLIRKDQYRIKRYRYGSRRLSRLIQLLQTIWKHSYNGNWDNIHVKHAIYNYSHLLGRNYYFLDRPGNVEIILQCHLEQVSEDFFETHRREINWLNLCSNTDISEAFFEAHEVRIHWDVLCLNRNISEAFFEKNLKEVSWPVLCGNPGISEAFLERYQDKLFWDNISRRQDLSETFLEKHVDRLNFFYLSGNPTVSEAFFERHISRIKWVSLGDNPGISQQFFETHINEIDHQGWSSITANPNVSLSFFSRYQFPAYMTWKGLPRCSERELEQFLAENNLHSSIWDRISRYANCSEEFWQRHIDKIVWIEFCANPNVSGDFFLKHRFKLSWKVLVTNEGLPIEFFEQHLRGADNLHNLHCFDLPALITITDRCTKAFYRFRHQELLENLISQYSSYHPLAEVLRLLI